MFEIDGTKEKSKLKVRDRKESRGSQFTNG